MKKNIRRNLIIIIGILLLIVAIGVTFLKTTNKEQKSTDSIVVKDNVTVITAETIKDKQPIKVTDNELIFSNNPQYSKGDVIVSGIIDSAPSGFIRKVVGTTNNNNNYIVKTEYGVLTDVFEEVHIKKTFELTKDGANEVDSNSIKQVSMGGKLENLSYAHPSSHNENTMDVKTATLMSFLDNETGYQFTKEFEYDVAQGISAKGSVGFNVWLEVEFDISNGDVIFGIVAHNESDGSISIEASAEAKKEFEKELFSKKLPNFQFVIGIIPIVITNEIMADFECEYNIQGTIGTSFEIKSENSSGFQYTSKTNKVKEIKDKKYLSDGLKWGTEAKFSGGNSSGVKLHLISKLYDSTGADISVGIEEKLEGEVSTSPKKSLDGLNYVGSVDLSINPKLQGSIVVSVPIIDRKLAEMQIFEMELEPFWEKHWESGNSPEPIGLNNTYTTRFGEVNSITCPKFQFNYSDNWKVTKEEINNEAFGERDIITNNRGTTITYMQFARMNGLGNEGRFMQKIEASKVDDSSFVPSKYPAGTGGPTEDYSLLGNFIVAKLKIVGELNMDGSVIYAVVPESYVGIHEVVGNSGLYSKFSFKYPSPYAFIAEPTASNHKFTEDEEKEVIEILASFKNK